MTCIDPPLPSPPPERGQPYGLLLCVFLRRSCAAHAVFLYFAGFREAAVVFRATNEKHKNVLHLANLTDDFIGDVEGGGDVVAVLG